MACNCNNDKTNCYNISMGCVVPALANPNAYYTKSEIDEKLEDIVTSGCCITPEEVDEKIESAITDIDLSEYAKKSEIPTVPTNVSAFVNDVPYLTEHQSLSGYATQQWVTDQGYLTEHQSLEGYATQQWVQNQHYITGVDLSDYATKEYVSGYTYDKETIDEKVAGGGSFDPTQYYNKTQTNDLLDEKLDVTAYTPSDLSNYYTKSETNAQISSSTADMATKTWVNNQGYLTEHQDLSNYDTKAEVNTKISTATGLVNSALTAHTANTTVHVTQSEKNTWNNKSDFSGDYTDLANKPTIPNYTAGSGISIVNDVISYTGGSIDAYTKTESNNKFATITNFNSHSGNTNMHVTASEKNTWNNKVDSSTLNNYLLKSKIWCGTQSQYDSITNKDSETLYLIHA